jgi:hypothetical protein
MNSFLSFLSHGALPMAMLLPNALSTGREPEFATLARVSCKQVNSCEEAVEIWCGGYRRADADDDGIPCENVCHSVEQVDTIKSSQGC